MRQIWEQPKCHILWKTEHAMSFQCKLTLKLSRLWISEQNMRQRSVISKTSVYEQPKCQNFIKTEHTMSSRCKLTLKLSRVWISEQNMIHEKSNIEFKTRYPWLPYWIDPFLMNPLLESILKLKLYNEWKICHQLSLKFSVFT